MKIWMVLLNEFTHDARVYREATSLAQTGHDVTVCALWRPDLPEREAKDGFEVHRIRLKISRESRILFLRYGEFLVKAVGQSLQESVDVYHAHDAKALPIAFLAAKARRAKLVYDAHEFEADRNFGPTIPLLYQRLWTLPEKLLIGKADAVITVCDSIADELVRLYAIKRPIVLMNCPELSITEPTTKLRNCLNIEDGKRIVLYQGGLQANRGLEELVTSVKYMRQDTVLVFIGDGPLRTSLEKRARSLGLERRVKFTGWIPLRDLPPYTASADVGVVAYANTCLNHYYATPNKLFEYLMAGLPIATSNFPEMAKVVKSYQVGQVFDPADPEDIARAINYILADDERYEEMRRNARRAVEERYNWGIESQKLLALYDSLSG